MHQKIDRICHRIALSHAVFALIICCAAILLLCIEPEWWMLAMPVSIALAVYCLIRSLGSIISASLKRCRD